MIQIVMKGLLIMNRLNLYNKPFIQPRKYLNHNVEHHIIWVTYFNMVSLTNVYCRYDLEI